MPDLWEIKITITDDKRKRSSHKFYLHPDDYPVYSDVTDYVYDYALKLEPLIAGQISGLNITRVVEVTPGVPAVDSDVEETLYVIYNLSDGAKLRQSLATWKDAFLNPQMDDKKRRPTFDADVTAWRNLMAVAPSLGYPSNPCDKRGISITSFDDAYQKFKRSRR